MTEQKTRPSLIDIGLNLTHDSFDHDRKDVLQRALDLGVHRMILTGATEEGSLKGLELAKSYPGTFYTTAGIHPHHAKEVNGDTFTVLQELYTLPEVVAVGECGLDYFRDISPRSTQEKVFIAHLEMAKGNQLPMFLHQRDAGDTFISILMRMEIKVSPASRWCRNIGN